MTTPGSQNAAYRLRVHRVDEGAWRGEVTDLTTGDATTVRDLMVAASFLGDPMVWSEVFRRAATIPR